MSLYNSILSQLAPPGLTGVSSGARCAIRQAGADIAEQLGGGSFARQASGVLVDAALSRVSPVLNKLDHFFGRALGGRFPAQHYWQTPTQMFGGITPEEAYRIYQEVRGGNHAKKNLWLLQVSSGLSGEDKAFNLFATEIEYSPFIISGEKTKVGGAVLDRAEGCEPVELTITTYDDRAGTLKDWFSRHHAAIAHKDGTMGLPKEYAVTIKITHGINNERLSGGWSGKGLFRPSNLQTSLSRRDDMLEELQMTFSQMDTFMDVT